MKIFNSVRVLIFKFSCIIVFTPIARFVLSSSIYQRIPPVDVSNPNGTVIFDVLRDTDDFYPLGLISNPSSGSKEYIVDDLVTFGKEITIVFGTKYVSLSPFARNIKLTAKLVNLRQQVHISYDLSGTKILKKYLEHGLTPIGQPKSFKLEETGAILDADGFDKSDVGTDDGSEQEESEQQTKFIISPNGHSIPINIDVKEQGATTPDDKELHVTEKDEGETKVITAKAPDMGVLTTSSDGGPTTHASQDLPVSDDATPSPVASTPGTDQGVLQEVPKPTVSEDATPSAVASTPETDQVVLQQVPKPTDSGTEQVDVVSVVDPSEKIDLIEEVLTGKTGFKSADIVRAISSDFRCVWFENTESNQVYKKLEFKGHTFPLSKSADAFEVCYEEYDPGKYNMVVSTQFSSIVVEQIYKTGPLKIEPLLNFELFVGLKSYSERRLDSGSGSTTAPFELDLNNFRPDASSAYDEVVAGTCKVYRYKDGLEDDTRIGAVTSLKFGSYVYTIPSPKKFVMVSKCNPHLSTHYVVIMLKDFFQYESVVFYSADGLTYRENRTLEDYDRLALINMTSKVWHKRQSNGAMGTFTDGRDEEVQVLCLSQFTKKQTNNSPECKKIDTLSNFKLVYHGDDLTNIVFTKNSPKSSVVIGNAMFDLTRDSNNEKYIYLSHPADEPISLLVENSDREHYCITEKSVLSNVFLPVTNSFNSLKHRSNKKDVNFGIYKSNLYGITWDYNDYLKKYYLFPSKFPDYCLGDLTFKNMKIMSNKEEGYKQITSDSYTTIEKVTVTIMLPKGKMVLEVWADRNKSTKVEMTTTTSEVARRDEL